MKKIEMIKNAGGIIVATGVTAIVNCIVKDATSEETGTIKRICIGAGAIVLSAMAVDKAVDFVNEKVDSAVSGAKQLVEEIEENK